MKSTTRNRSAELIWTNVFLPASSCDRNWLGVQHSEFNVPLLSAARPLTWSPDLPVADRFLVAQLWNWQRWCRWAHLRSHCTLEQLCTLKKKKQQTTTKKNNLFVSSLCAFLVRFRFVIVCARLKKKKRKEKSVLLKFHRRCSIRTFPDSLPPLQKEEENCSRGWLHSQPPWSPKHAGEAFKQEQNHESSSMLSFVYALGSIKGRGK